MPISYSPPRKSQHLNASNYNYCDSLAILPDQLADLNALAATYSKVRVLVRNKREEKNPSFRLLSRRHQRNIYLRYAVKCGQKESLYTSSAFDKIVERIQNPIYIHADAGALSPQEIPALAYQNLYHMWGSLRTEKGNSLKAYATYIAVSSHIIETARNHEYRRGKHWKGNFVKFKISAHHIAKALGDGISHDTVTRILHMMNIQGHFMSRVSPKTDTYFKYPKNGKPYRYRAPVWDVYVSTYVLKNPNFGQGNSLSLACNYKPHLKSTQKIIRITKFLKGEINDLSLKILPSNRKQGNDAFTYAYRTKYIEYNDSIILGDTTKAILGPPEE